MLSCQREEAAAGLGGAGYITCAGGPSGAHSPEALYPAQRPALGWGCGAGAWHSPPPLTACVWNVQMFPWGLRLAPRPQSASGLGSSRLESRHPGHSPLWQRKKLRQLWAAGQLPGLPGGFVSLALKGTALEGTQGTLQTCCHSDPQSSPLYQPTHLYTKVPFCLGPGTPSLPFILPFPLSSHPSTASPPHFHFEAWDVSRDRALCGEEGRGSCLCPEDWEGS